MFKEKGFGVPAAIVVAGAIVALAIIFGGNGMKKTPVNMADASVVEIAVELGVKEKALNKCIASGEATAKVEAEMTSVDISGTPTSFVVDTVTGTTVQVVGAQPYTVMKALIDQILADDPEIAKLDIDVEVPEVTEQDHVNGSREARIQVIEYSDFDCPFCGRFHETMNQLISEYGEAGDVAWVYRHSPIEQLHPNAKEKSVVSECISELEGEEAFWEFTDIMFAS
jgi:protein-disulfide isomerase